MGNIFSGGESAANMKAAAAFVEEELQQEEVVIFSKSYCPFCTKAKESLDSIGVQYKTVEIENRPDMNTIQDYMKQKTGARSVPRVFIHGKFYGGGDDTAAGARSGHLLKTLRNR